jgi:PAS domain S-box-containing protein
MSEIFNNIKENTASQNDLENKLSLSYKTIADFTYDIEICRDVNGNCVYVNPALQRLLGYSTEDYKNGKIAFEDIVHPDDRHIPKEYMSKLLTMEEFDDIELRLLKKDETIIYASMSSQPIIDDQGQYLGRRTSIRDITRRKRAEQQLVASNEKYMSLVNTIGLGVLLIDSNMRIQFANPQAKKWFHLETVEYHPLCFSVINIANSNGLKGISPDCPTKKTFQDGKRHRAEFTTQINGSKKVFKVISTPVKNDEGIISSVIELIEDVTLEKQQQEQLIENKNQLEEIIDNASEIIISFDINNNVYLWNKTAEQVTGFSRHQVIGKSVFNLEIFENPSSIQDALDAVKNEKSNPRNLITFKDDNGKKRLLQPSYSVISGKHIKGVLLVGTDITEDKEKHGKILPGNAYLLESETNKEVIPIIRHLIHEGSECLFISRLKVMKYFKAAGLTKVNYLNFNSLSSTDDSNYSSFLIKNIRDYVTCFCKKHRNGVIYLDRLDYVLFHHSFTETLKLLYRLHESVFETNCVLIIRINPGLLSIKQLAAVKEELDPLPSRDVATIELEDKLFSILMFINEKQEANAIVSFKSIKKEFSIVDVTVKKRLTDLENLGLIFIKRKGRMKTIHITEKGRHILSKRQMV